MVITRRISEPNGINRGINAHEERDTITSDTPNAFTQAHLKREKGKARVTMKITEVLVELPVKKAPHMCKGFVVFEHGQKVMHLNALKVTHRMLESASLWHQNFDQTWNQLDLHFIHAMHAQQTGVQMRSNTPCNFMWMI